MNINKNLDFTEINVDIEDIFEEYNNDFKANILKTFGMAVPTSVKLYATKDLIDKIKLTADICTNNKFSTISFLNTSESSVDLYSNNRLINTQKYDDFDTQFNVYKSKQFSIHYDIIYKSFYLELLYRCSWTEFVFKTKRFII